MNNNWFINEQGKKAAGGIHLCPLLNTIWVTQPRELSIGFNRNKTGQKQQTVYL